MRLEKNSGSCAGLWRKLTIAVLLLTALCAVSCKSPTRLEKTTSLDSLRDVRRFALIQQPIPPSLAKTAFPTAILNRIPIGTGFSARSGQATVNVNRISGDSIEVTATCDSLAREVIVLTEENTRIRNELLEKEEDPPPEVVHEPTGWQWFQIWIGRITLLTLSLTIIYRLLKRRLNKS